MIEHLLLVREVLPEIIFAIEQGNIFGIPSDSPNPLYRLTKAQGMLYIILKMNDDNSRCILSKMKEAYDDRLKSCIKEHHIKYNVETIDDIKETDGLRTTINRQCVSAMKKSVSQGQDAMQYQDHKTFESWKLRFPITVSFAYQGISFKNIQKLLEECQQAIKE